ncbi:uncharacterized protein LOC110026266 isoform X2 [Phalaenopsis equestris]|uniref:uncharacterized protein LOC110026266 isoform X1 n=1 Tax=Phalaenopsis equestris TaxID=78828 RepID=UPI0009E5DD14|nr:uncharacterized protein LOC110026266 isoform X1 [Phalaenopsis equestris]XP_020582803.1 uncharacterized protein LOC110026266 isoform X2 [Phalaenopsis equestris]
MAVPCNLLRAPFTTHPTFPSSHSARSFNPSVLSRRNFTTHSTGASTPGSLRSAAGGPIDPLAEVMNPALSYANVLFFDSGYNVQIFVEENEPEEALLRRFRREVSKAGIIPECKRRRFFENAQEEKKRKAREAGRRNRRRKYSGQRFSSASQEENIPNKKAIDDMDDNWDLPEGGIPG